MCWMMLSLVIDASAGWSVAAETAVSRLADSPPERHATVATTNEHANRRSIFTGTPVVDDREYYTTATGRGQTNPSAPAEVSPAIRATRHLASQRYQLVRRNDLRRVPLAAVVFA